MDNGTRGVSAIVEYDYTAKESDELDLIKGAIIHKIKQQPGGWWEGTLLSNGRTGMFPDNFVRVLDANDDKNVMLREKSATTNRRCKVIYSYSQVNDDELSLAVGDVIDFLGEVEEGWWRGKLKGKVGVFPSNFVVTIESSPIFASKRPPTNSVDKTSATTTASAADVTSVPNSSGKLIRVKGYGSKDDLLSQQQQQNHNIIVPSSSSSSELIDAAAPILPPKPIREYCRVVYPYSPKNDDELELTIGDVITIISTDLPDKGWWKGELKGTIGVFPDNFVKLIAPNDVSPINDSHQQQKQHQQHSQHTASFETGQSTTLHPSATAVTTTTSPSSTSSSSAVASSKVYVKKSGSTSSTQSSNRKDSFGSRDSLNDILSETGIQSGNVAAQRKSLENKNLELTNSQLIVGGSGSSVGGIGDATSRMAARKTSADSKANELRKSLDSSTASMDEKKTPPPVLTKKPTVPSKKSGSVTSVAGNILSGLKQKVKNVENKLHSSTTATSSQDSADGIGCSKVSPQQMIADNNEKNVVAERLRRDDSEFDRVERASMLPDMRAGRVKAPKRRPPSSAINAVGENNNNNSVYLNGSANSYIMLDGEGRTVSATVAAAGTTASSDDNSEEQLAKPKPREWEKKKAPWMEELKASQVKKKTSPNVEPRTIMTDRSSKSIDIDSKTHITVSSGSQMQHSMSLDKKDNLLSNDTSRMSTSVTQQMLGAADTSIGDDIRMRPSSLSIRNRSISPIGRVSGTGTAVAAGAGSTATTAAKSASSLDHKNAPSTSIISTSYSAASISTTGQIPNQNHNNSENNITATANSITKQNSSVSSSSESGKVNELERRVEKLESQVQLQQKIIEDLVRTLREETDRVKGLKSELDKYAQCVTQV